MTLSSSLYSGISGLNTQGGAMAVLGDNVANVNTVSFKSNRASFQDALSQSVATATGVDQVGRGVTLGAVNGQFAQGSFESTTSPTDLAIGGQGFFILRDVESTEASLYTRAGEFRFDQDGNLVSPNGYFVQGWEIDDATRERSGTIKDVVIDKNTAPVATSAIDVVVNLDSRELNETNETRLFEAWNGNNAAALVTTPAIAASDYEYTTSIKVYDTQGASHDITIFFDRTTSDNQWEFLVTCDPTEDLRYLPDGVDEDGVADGTPNWQTVYAPNQRYNYEDHKGAGALLYGVMQYNTAGDITDVAAYRVPPDGKVDPSLGDNRLSLTAFDKYYSFEYNFTGDTTNQGVTLNFGAKYTGQSTNQTQIIVSDNGAYSSSSGSKTIFAETQWSSVFDSAGKSISDGDVFVFEGNKHNGMAAERLVYTVDKSKKVQDLLDALKANFECSVAIDTKGRLKFTSTQGGESGLAITSFKTFSTSGVVPFGGSAIIRKNWAQSSISFKDSNNPETGVAITDSDTALTNAVLSNGVELTTGFKLRFSGYTVGSLDTSENYEGKITGNSMGKYINPQPVNSTFTVGTDGTTIQDLLTWIETEYGSASEAGTVSAVLGFDGKIKVIDNTVTVGNEDGGSLKFNIDFVGDLHMPLADTSGGAVTIVAAGANTGQTDRLYKVDGTPISTATTRLTDIFSGDGSRQVMIGDSYTFGGINTNGTNVTTDTFVVGTDGETIQDLLDWIPTLYEMVPGDVTATLLSTGEIEITDINTTGNLVVTLTKTTGVLAKPLGDDHVNLLVPSRPLGADATTFVNAGATLGAGSAGPLYLNEFGNSINNNFIGDADTSLLNLYDQNGYRLQAGDIMTFSGVARNGVAIVVPQQFTVGTDGGTVQDLMDWVADLYTDGVVDGAPTTVTVSFNTVTGMIDINDGNGALSSMVVTLDSTTKAPTTFFKNASGTTIIDRNTALVNCYDNNGLRIKKGDTYTFTGADLNGNEVNGSFVVGEDGASIDDLLDWLADLYDDGDVLNLTTTATPNTNAVTIKPFGADGTTTAVNGVTGIAVVSGSLFIDSSQTTPLTSANTTLVSVYDSAGNSFQTGDVLTFSGTDANNAVIAAPASFTVGTDGTTVQDLMTWLSDLYADGVISVPPTADADVTVSINAGGQIEMQDNLGGFTMSVTIDSTVGAGLDVFLDGTGALTFYNNDNPGTLPTAILDWSGLGMSTLDSNEGQINVNTAKRKVLSQGRGLATNSQSPPYIGKDTLWASVYNDAGINVTNGDKITFNGAKSDGTTVSVTYTIDTTSPNNKSVSDLLTKLESTFDCDADIDPAGRLVLTERVADDSAFSSRLALSTITYDYAETIPTNTNFHAVFGYGASAIAGDQTLEDGSRVGGEFSSNFESEALSSTQYANSSTTILKDQDGYGSGFLQSISVDTEGIITGHYSNGQVLKKAQVALANFNNLAGLNKEGGNLYTETTDSGAAITGAAGTNGLGSIASNSLEQSNVDLGTEFVKLITTQRGYQAASKIITTVDTMLDTLLNIKR